MYNIIKNPETNKNVSIYSKKGIAILEKYLNNLTGGIGGLNGITGFLKNAASDINPVKNQKKKIKKKETLELDMPDEFRSDDYQSKLKIIIDIINSKEHLFDSNMKQFYGKNLKYLNKNMLYFVIPFAWYFQSFAKPKIEEFKTKYNSENKDFFTKIYIDKNEYDFDTNIYEFHLTNIISVVFILYTFVSGILSISPMSTDNDEIKSLEDTKKIVKEIIKKIKKLEIYNNESQKFELLKKIHSDLTQRFMLIVANQVAYHNLLFQINHALENAAKDI
mgnify:CR=1 FL=1